MKLSLKKNALRAIAFLIIFVPASIAAQLTPYNYAQAGLALARAPLASLSQRYHHDHSRTAKLIHCATDLTRIGAELLNHLNHPGDGFFTSSFFWSFFDAANLGLDLIAQDHAPASIINNSDLSENNNDLAENPEDTPAPVAQLTEKQYETLNQIIEATQEYILPFAESASAFMLALNTDQTPEAQLERRRMQAICSLSRALSVYANHKKSIPAIVLLIGAVAEMTLAVQAHPPVQNQVLVPLPNNQLHRPGPVPQENNGEQERIQQLRQQILELPHGEERAALIGQLVILLPGGEERVELIRQQVGRPAPQTDEERRRQAIEFSF